MRLFYRDEKPNYDKVCETVSKGYAIKNPGRISGYAGTFLFTLLDVYLSNGLEDLLVSTPNASNELMNLLVRFKKEDYGEISPDEEFQNGEQRYICGGHYWMIARYKTCFGVIIFESFYDLSLLYFDGEDVDSIRKAHNHMNKT